MRSEEKGIMSMKALKQLFLLCLICMMSIGASAQEWHQCDANHDGVVDVADITTVATYILTGELPKEPEPAWYLGTWKTSGTSIIWGYTFKEDMSGTYYEGNNTSNITYEYDDNSQQFTITLPRGNKESFTVIDYAEKEYMDIRFSSESSSTRLYYEGNDDPYNGHEYVDLGLPSGLKWATCNVGATSPEDYGDHYAWGEIETKKFYEWITYKWCNGSYNTMTKYCTNSSYGYNGFTDNKTTLDIEDDVAHVKWGGNWRMPTKAEQEELINNCTLTWTAVNGVPGYRVQSRIDGYTDKYIFLPAAGFHDESLSCVGKRCMYWSSSLDESSSDYASDMSFETTTYCTISFHDRNLGSCVRPVAE